VARDACRHRAGTSVRGFLQIVRPSVVTLEPLRPLPEDDKGKSALFKGRASRGHPARSQCAYMKWIMLVWCYCHDASGGMSVQRAPDWDQVYDSAAACEKAAHKDPTHHIVRWKCVRADKADKAMTQL
jgi:hypothetical protein